MNNCVYRFINKYNEVIYLGKAKDLEKRLKGHNHLPEECYEERVFIEYTEFENEHEMDFAERYYIQKVNPKYNTQLADRQISFNCKDLDKKVFKVYEVNEYVVERTLEQVELLKKEDMFAELNTSIIKLAGMFTIYKCKDFMSKSKEECQNLKFYNELKKWKEEFYDKISDYIKELKNKYYLLDIVLKFKDIDNIGKHLNLEKCEYLLELRYKEKYKEEYKKLDFIIRCVN